MSSSQAAIVDKKSYFKDLSLCFYNFASNFWSSILIANLQHNRIIFIDPFVHAHDSILYPWHYSYLQNIVEAVDHSLLACHVPLVCNNYSVMRLVSKAYALRISTKTSMLVDIISIFGGFYLYALLSSM